MHHDHVIVAVTLWHEGKICLLRRSASVSSDPGLWHCVTGFLEHGSTPSEQALQEVQEETGAAGTSLRRFEDAGAVTLSDGLNRTWTIHTFAAETACTVLHLNWEHDAYAWWSPRDLPAGHVAWLPSAIAHLTTRPTR